MLKLIGLKTIGFPCFKNYVRNMTKWTISERLSTNMMKMFLISALVAFSYMFTFYMGYVFAVEIFELFCLKTDLLTESF